MPHRHRIRDRLPFLPRSEPLFRWRSREPSRLEGFADTVFAFTVTLLVVALEVPRTFAGLMDVLRNFPAFVVCFALLMHFWNSHYRFFRRYALEDIPTRMLNYGILLLVLFSVYPLKFLFSSWFNPLFGGGQSPAFTDINQLYLVYVVYGLGLAGIQILYALLYGHAWRLREALELTPAESLLTRAAIWEYRLWVAVCLFSVGLALLRASPMAPGLAYILLGVVLGFNGWRYRRQIRALTAGEPGAEP